MWITLKELFRNCRCICISKCDIKIIISEKKEQFKDKLKRMKTKVGN